MATMEDKVSEALKKIHHALNIKAKSVLSCIRYDDNPFRNLLVETGLDVTIVFSMDSDLKTPHGNIICQLHEISVRVVCDYQTKANEEYRAVGCHRIVDGEVILNPFPHQYRIETTLRTSLADKTLPQVEVASVDDIPEDLLTLLKQYI